MLVRGLVRGIEVGETPRGKQEVRLRVVDDTADAVTVKLYPDGSTVGCEAGDVVEVEIGALLPWANGRRCDVLGRSVRVVGHMTIVPNGTVSAR